MIGMAVRDPQVFAAPDRIELLRANFVRETPAAEIRRPCDPRVRREQRDLVMQDQCRIADGIEPELHPSYLLQRQAIWQLSGDRQSETEFPPISDARRAQCRVEGPS